MGVLTIRKLDDDTKTRLRLAAAAKGISMEEEARRRLKDSLDASEPAKMKPTVADLLRFSVKPAAAFDLKAVSDELSEEGFQ